ncbi:MAG: serine/threonine protein kinase [Myxococcales bacterium]|nr:serine/threonine protein kinase [Myxococcales bacterium]MCB9644473.1 serine/threonine protein kinase [Myxococcales bacterium]
MATFSTPHNGTSWQCTELIYDGTMSSVFRGIDPHTRQEVAIKRLSEDKSQVSPWGERFQEEAFLLSSLQHPNIVRYIGQGNDAQDIPYIVTEWLEGKTLRQKMPSGTALSIPALVPIFSGLAEALSYLHREGVVHRDLKPANIVLCPSQTGEDIPKLVDFGIAFSFRQGEQPTQDPFTLGTPLYMSPEQAQGLSVGPSADLYAFGVMLFEALTGYTPFQGENIYSIMAGHIHIPPPLPRDFAPQFEQYPEIERLVLWALEKSPVHRPADVQSFWASMMETFAFYGLIDKLEVPSAFAEHMPSKTTTTPTMPAVQGIAADYSWLAAGPTLVEPPLHPEAPTPAQAQPRFYYQTSIPTHTFNETPSHSQASAYYEQPPERANTPANLVIFASKHTLGTPSSALPQRFSWEAFFEETRKNNPLIEGFGLYDFHQSDWKENHGTKFGYMGLIQCRQIIAALQYAHDEAEGTYQRFSFMEGSHRNDRFSYYYAPLQQSPHLLLLLAFSSKVGAQQLFLSGQELQQRLQGIPSFVLVE